MTDPAARCYKGEDFSHADLAPAPQ
jgi:hypothetical protein